MDKDTPKEPVNEQQLFIDMFQGMPLERAKPIIIEHISNAQSWEKLGQGLTTGLRICAINQGYSAGGHPDNA